MPTNALPSDLQPSMPLQTSTLQSGSSLVNTQNHIQKALLGLGALLFASGLISFFAFNWKALSAGEKFALLMATMIGAALLSLKLKASARSAALFLAFVATGVLLATIGQTYQTGADAWQLFAVWALLGALWAFAARSAFLWVLVLLLAQLAALRYANVQFGLLEFIFAGLSGPRSLFPLALAWAFLLLWELSSAFQPGLGMQGRLGSRLQALLIIVMSTRLGLEGILFRGEGSLATVAIVSLLALALLSWRWLRDLPILGFTLIAGNVLVVSVLGRVMNDSHPLRNGLLLGLIFVALSALIVTWLKKQIDVVPKSDDATGTEPRRVDNPWYLQLMMGFAAWVGAIFLLGFVGSIMVMLTQSLGSRAMSWSVLGLLAIGLAYVLLRKPGRLAQDQFGLAFSLAGQGALFAGLESYFQPHSVTQARPMAACILVVYAILVVMFRQAGHRFLSMLGFWSGVLFWMYTVFAPQMPRNLPEVGFYRPLIILALLVLGLVIFFERTAKAQPETLQPSLPAQLTAVSPLRSAKPVLVWSSLFALAISAFVFGVLLPKLISEFDLLRSGQDALDHVRYAARLEWAIASSALFAFASLFFIGPKLAPKVRMATIGLLVVLLLGLHQTPLFFLGLLFLSLAWPQSKLWSLGGAVLVLIGFSAFYYDLTWSLRAKSLVLAALGAAVLLARYLWLKSLAKVNVNVRGEVASSTLGVLERKGLFLKPAFASSLALALVASIGSASYGIYSKERIIREGQRIFLEVAPRDPRSLMQGDYMALQFKLAREIAHMRGVDGDIASMKLFGFEREGLVSITLDEKRIAHLRIDHQRGDPNNTDRQSAGQQSAGQQSAGQQALSLRYQRVAGRNFWGGSDPVQISTNAWFFQEGEATRYEPARYGEFAVNSQGEALLLGLRDKELKPL